jgi:Tol biopolymer transport system component
LEAGTGKRTTIGSAEGFGILGWSPDGEWLALQRWATSTPGSELVLYSTSASEFLMLPLSNVPHVSWTPDSAYLYAMDASDTETLYRVDVSAGEKVEVLHGEGFIADFDVSGNEHGVAVGFTPNAVAEDARILTMALDGTDQQELVSLAGDVGLGVEHVSWSPDGDRLAYGRRRLEGDTATSETVIAVVPGGESTQVSAVQGSDWGVDVDSHWSPDGQWLLIERLSCTQCEPAGPRIALAKTDGSSATVLPGQEEWPRGAAAWAPDGEHFAYSADKLYIANKDGSGVAAIVDMPGSNFTPVSWHPSGAHIYFVRRPAQPQVFYAVNANGSDLEVMHVGSLLPTRNGDVAYGDSEGVYIKSRDGQVVEVDLPGGIPGVGFSSLVWSPDGSHLAILLGDKGEHGLGIATRDGEFRLVADRGPTGDPSWSPEGDLVAYRANGGLWVVDASGGEPRRLADAPSFFQDWSPDGTELAFFNDGVVWSVQVDGSDPRRLFEVDPGVDGANVRWSPDGERIAVFGPFANDRQTLSIGSIDGDVSKLVTDPFFDNVEWTSDGRNLVAQYNGGDGTNREPGIYLIDTASGEWTPLTEAQGRLHQLIGVREDGRILFASYFAL